jgi:hypothetical protein
MSLNSPSKCPVCKNTSFEAVDQNVSGSYHTLTFIRCSSCESVVGTMDRLNIGVVLGKIADKLGVTV